MLIDYSFYLSVPENIDKAEALTGISLDEIEQIVGRFTNRSQWVNQLRGEVCVGFDGEVLIRHHFTKKVLWKK